MFPNIFVIVLKHELEDILAQEESQDATHLNYENWQRDQSKNAPPRNHASQ